MRKIVIRQERLGAVDTALDSFGKQYNIPAEVLHRLREALVFIPPDVEIQEKRLLVGLSARPSDVVVPDFSSNLKAALKEVGWWQKFSPKGRDVIRKRLARRGKQTTTHGNVTNRRRGRPPYAYADLEKSYALAIARTLNNTFPISRSANGKLYGAAFSLLEAALYHALPHAGASGHEGRAMRLRAIFRRSLDN